MAIDTIRADIEALAQARAEGRPLDPEIVDRVRERARRAREETVKLHGIQDIGVDLIRQARDSR
jgi:hypothetical protein